MRKGLRNEWLTMLGAASGLCFLAGRKRAGVGFALAAGGLFAALPVEQETFEGQSALITGGSRGLGLALALELARQGARVAILARDEDELREAQRRIEAAVPDAVVFSIPCDITDALALGHALERAAFAHGGIDLLVNNAGAITIGPWETFERADYASLLELHFYAVLEACRRALPYLRESRGRRILNIVSMGGKAGVPHMLPYDVSKFALAGLTQGLAAELAGEGISVTGIYPTVMRTGSQIQATFRGNQEEEFVWFSAGASAPGMALEAAAAARKFLRAALHRDYELVPSALGKARNVGAALFPETFQGMMALAARALPASRAGELQTGQESRSLWDRLAVLAPLRWFERRAERSWNQKPRHSAYYNEGRDALNLRRAAGMEGK